MNISLASSLWKSLFRKCNYYTEATAIIAKEPSTRTQSQRSRLIDKIRVYVRGGTGGQGCASSGGLGGNGGHVYIKCLKGSSLTTYATLQNRRIIAGHGGHHIKSKMKVDNGKNVYIYVPPGTEIKTNDNFLITELNKDSQVIKIANGGAGGSARTEAFNGKKGERKNIVLELKLIADAALTGFPNAGKSSLLRALSRARPKVGEYPFTTINPSVGSIFYDDDTKVTVADLPGLIEDSYLNKGMGHKFLRHVERTKVILLVVDIKGFQLRSNHPFRTPFETVVLLLKELSLYQDVLLNRPFYLIINKMDLLDSETKYKTLMDGLQHIEANHELIKDNENAENIVSCIRQILQNNNIVKTSAITQVGLELVKKCLHQNISFDAEE